MLRHLMKSKIHRVTVTRCDLNYAGSITLDPDLMESADIVPHELVHVLNINNGERFETYAIPGRSGSGEVQVNGAAARLASPGDMAIVISYATYDEAEVAEHRPRVVHVDERNAIASVDAQASHPRLAEVGAASRTG